MTDHTDYKTLLEPQIVCPHCYHVDDDSWEFDEEDDEYECGSCERTSHLNVEVSTTYTTETFENRLKGQVQITKRLIEDYKHDPEKLKLWQQTLKHELAELDALLNPSKEPTDGD